MIVGVFLTDRCNYQCKHCMVNSKIENYTLTDDKILDRFIDTIKLNKPDKVSIVGGEPLLFLDKVEELANIIKPLCNNILIYSNGTFLLDEQKRERVKSMGVQIRLSRTDFHKEFWTPEIEKLINSSDYIKIDGLDGRADVFPRGRALKNKVYNDYPCPCSLVTQDYDSFYHSHRILIMPDGSVNIWCPCMSLELANVLTDKEVTHDLLVEREKLLRGYLESVNMIYDSMEFMCNQVCDRFKVTNKGIFRDDELMKKF